MSEVDCDRMERAAEHVERANDPVPPMEDEAPEAAGFAVVAADAFNPPGRAHHRPT